MPTPGLTGNKAMKEIYIEQYGYAAWRDVEDLLEMIEAMDNGVEDPDLF